MAAPKLWYDVPLSVRNISSINAFKNALKTHLFQKAFPTLFILLITRNDLKIRLFVNLNLY